MEPNRIKSWRKARGISQVVLAKRLGVNQATVSRLEKGEQELTMEWAMKLTKELGLSDPFELWHRDMLDYDVADLVEFRVSASKTPDLKTYRVQTDVLVRAGIEKHAKIMARVALDGSSIDPKALRSGQIVVAQRRNRLFLRQFLEPGLLCSNGEVRWNMSLLDDDSVRVLGVFVTKLG